MSEPQHPLDYTALGLLLAGLLVAGCLFSYDPADPPFPLVHPAHDAPANLLGRPGAALATRLLTALGWTAYLLLGAWFVLVLLLARREDWRHWLRRLGGWVLLIPGAAVLAWTAGASFEGKLPAGSGGTIGAWLTDSLDTHVTAVGRLTLALGAVCCGIWLCADSLVRRVWGVIRIAAAPLIAILRAVAGALARERVQPAAPEAPPVPIKKKQPITAPDPARAEPTSVEEDDEELPQPESREEDPWVIPIKHHDTQVSPDPEPEEEEEELTAVGHSEQQRYEGFEIPSLELLEDPQPFPFEEHDEELRRCAALLEKTFTDFGLSVKVVGINTGPVITQYEIALETGLRLSRVTALADDLALNLKVASVHIVAPIPGKNTVGVEVPNEYRATVRLKEVLQTGDRKVARQKIPLFLGKDTEGRPLIQDLADMPHLLIAGRTGTGKSVCMNAIILSMLMTRRPDEVKMLMIDPKMLELSEYGKIPHLMHPVVKDMKKAEAILSWAVDKMEERYDLLARARVRNIAGYNELSREEVLRRLKPADETEAAALPERMPYIVIFVDEMNDLMMTMKKEVEGHIIRLAQKSRAAGIHLVVATQKPTVDVITGLIKSNLPARICFQVSSRSDSRVVLDEMGAEKLLGKGDMLFLQPGTSTLVRAQGTYLSDEEISRVVGTIECEPTFEAELIELKSKDGEGGLGEALRNRDDLYEAAIEVVVREGRGSVSLLQRSLGIGYGRAARLIDFMAEDGIVGAYNGSNAREVMYTPEQWGEMRSRAGEAS